MIKSHQRTKSIRVNGVDLHYTETGKGAPVLLVHGSLSDFRTWGLQRKAFSKHYHVIAYSRRHHYPNAQTRDKAHYTPAVHADDLAAFIQARKLGAVHLIGSSYGAYVSLLMAAKHPELVRTLVLGEPPILGLLKNDARGGILLKKFLDTAWKPAVRALHAGDDESGARFFYDGISSPGSFERLPQSVRAGMMENVPAMRREARETDELFRFPRRDALKITAPSFLLSGELSPELFHRITDILEDRLPRSERAVIHGASHSMHAHRPQAYNKAVLRFLALHEDPLQQGEANQTLSKNAQEVGRSSKGPLKH